MMVANSFDLWQKDVFFSAAEEVQESTDIMESMYRTWMRNRKELESEEYSEELRRELQTTLGTAKWQLEEFEKAVRLSRGNRSDDNTTARHKQFVAAIEDQIFRVEKALRESYNEEGKQPLRWVNLDEEERDDLAAFLSGTSGTVQGRKDEYIGIGPSNGISLPGNQLKRKDTEVEIECAFNGGIPDSINGFKVVLTTDKDAKFVVGSEEKDLPRAGDDTNCKGERSSGQRRTWSSPNFGALEIVIEDDNGQRKKSVESDEHAPKGKGFKNNFQKQKSGEHLPSKGVILSCDAFRGNSCFNQLFGRVGGFQRQLQGSRQMQYTCSLQLTLVFMLTIFIIVPFLVYTT